MQDYSYIFIGGLHRSGTSILHRSLREHPLISGFSETGVRQDEGQFLQTVYPLAKVYGGPGRFGFNREAHLTEVSPLACEENKAQLFSQWSRYWDTTQPFLLEKSPPNLLKMRFLQNLFPKSFFIILTRHPIAVSLATKKWKRNTSIYSLIKHWVWCHEILWSDVPYINNLMIINYEHFVLEPRSCLAAIYSFVGLDNHDSTMKVRSNINEAYFARWKQLRHGLVTKFYVDCLTAKFEDRVNHFGYSLLDLERINSDGERVLSSRGANRSRTLGDSI